MPSSVTLTVRPAGDVVVLDTWSDAVPDLGEGRAVQVEPRRWWLFDRSPAAVPPRSPAPPASGPAADTARTSPGPAAVSTAIGGGLVRATFAGPGWRALLMIAGVFDVEDPGFGPEACAATVIHHVPVWIMPLDADTCEVYFAASYAAGLVDLWTAAINRGVA